MFFRSSLMIRMYVCFSVLLSSVFLIPHHCPAATEVPSLQILLKNYTQALDSIQNITHTYDARTITSGYLPISGLNGRNRKSCKRGERGTDGKKRLFHTYYQWGYLDTFRGDVGETEAEHLMQVSTPEFSYHNYKSKRGKTPNGLIKYIKEEVPVLCSFSHPEDGYFLGYLGNDVRLDTILNKTKQIAVRSKPEIINGSVCYVVEADTAYGDFTLWLDPGHGYHPARLEAYRSTEEGDYDLQVDRSTIFEATQRWTFENIKFKEVEGIWVPIEYHYKNDTKWPMKKHWKRTKSLYTLSNVLLNPDHDALKSFANPIEHPELDPELVNGTAVCLGTTDLVYYVWQNGKMTPGKWRNGKLIPQ